MTKTSRRQFLAYSSALLVAPLAVEAQQAGKVYRVALVLGTAPVSVMAGPEPSHSYARAFVHGLRDLGYVEGGNLILERRSLEGKPERATAIAAELIGLNLDVIVSGINAMTHAAKAATTSVPIVMAGNLAPFEDGLVAGLVHPGGNVTGLSDDAGIEIDGKRLELLKRGVPRVSRVAFVGPRTVWELPRTKLLQARAQALGVTIFLAEVEATDFAPAFVVITRESADAIFAAATATNSSYRSRIIEFAAVSRLPASYQLRDAVEDGGLMSYGSKVTDVYRRAAAYVDKILKGAKPGDLPVEQPTTFEFTINLKTAKALNLEVPPSLLLRADQVIE